ncbi:hypothetical protein GQ53DRAFT_746212 [Thozetella sp. PMI_491]|nr:hypothetical protein GQ53DRAFT_746212 [Thozetella sp. PMI_491]
MAIGKEGNVKWVDGIRGFASILVVFTHISRAFFPDLFQPTSAEDAAPKLLQLPFIRILFQGRVGVCIFAFVTGYVCALKPIKLCQQGNQEAAFASMVKSALRRIPRLVLPAAFATVLIWILMTLGAFQVAKRCDSWWVSITSPEPVSPSLVKSMEHLIYNLWTTWATGVNQYDGHQWTMLPLLKGSMWVYMFMIGTSYVKQRYRMMLSLALYLFFYISAEPQLGMQFFWGIFLADLQNHDGANTLLVGHGRLCRMLSTVLIFFGLVLMSYPEDKAEWMAWSRAIHDLLVPILPTNADIPRFASGLGLQLVTLGLQFTPWTRELLSNRYFIWLGKQSFAVYLLHGLFIRTVLTWMLYGLTYPPDVQNDQGEWVHGPTPLFPGMARFYVSFVIWIPLLYGAANLWTTYVDPWCARVTELFVERVSLRKNEKPVVVPLR